MVMAEGRGAVGARIKGNSCDQDSNCIATCVATYRDCSLVTDFLLRNMCKTGCSGDSEGKTQAAPLRRWRSAGPKRPEQLRGGHEPSEILQIPH